MARTREYELVIAPLSDGGDNVEQGSEKLNSEMDRVFTFLVEDETHKNSTANPHSTTAAQVGAYTTTETDTAISTAIASLVDTSPSTLDTLNELAAALGDDPNLATTLTTSIATKADASALTAHIDNTSDAHLSTAIGFMQSGTGAVSRTAESKLKERVSVKDFGAVGNGVADDTEAIQAAIDSLHYKIFFPTGVYKVTEPIQLKTGVFLEGDKPPEGQPDESVSKIVSDGQSEIFKAGNGTRIYIDIHKIYFKGTGVENAISGDFGGQIKDCYFDTLHYGVLNPNGYLVQYINSFFVDCAKGIDTSVANSILLEQCFFHRNIIGAEIKTGYTVKISNCGGNLNHTAAESIFKLDSCFNVSDCYFEAFNAPIPTTAVFIDVSVNKFFPPIFVIQDCEFNSHSFHADQIRLNALTGQNDFLVNGLITRCRFASYTNSGIVYGENNKFNGVTLKDNNNLTVSNQYASYHVKPITATTLATGVSIVGASFIDVPVNGAVLYDNVDAFSTTANKYRTRKNGLYKITASIVCKSAASDYPSIEACIAKNNVAICSNKGHIKYSAAATYTTITIETVASLAIGDLITVRAKQGDTAEGGTFTCEYLGDGNY
jgi:hypothetical protein